MGGLPAVLPSLGHLVATMRHTPGWAANLDFRSEKSESAKGGRVAVNRWAGYHHNLDEDVIAEAFSTPARSTEDFEPEIRDAIAEDALERSELMASGWPGTWLAASTTWSGAAGSGRPSSARSAAFEPPIGRRLMALDQNGEGRKLYRCHHRGQGCVQPRRTNVGLLRASVLGLRLIGDDVELQSAIRTELERARTPARKAGGGPRARRSRHGVEDLVSQRRKLLRLYYADKIGADLFAE